MLAHALEKPQHLKLRYAPDSTGFGFFWPESEQKLKEALTVRRASPADFEATYQCRPGQRTGNIFLAQDLEYYFKPPAHLELGIQSPAVAEFIRNGHGVFQAWDTAFSTTSQSAHTVCVTGLFVPCDQYHCGEDPAILGPCEHHFDVLILHVFRERIDWGGLISAVKTLYYRWRPQEIIIEKKASGISLIQALQSSDLPIIGVGATDSKGARALNSVGVQSAGSVQGWFRQHRCMVPAYTTQLPPPELAWLPVWMAEMKDFSGADDASSDQVDATVHLVTRAIMMGAGMAVLPSDWSPERSALPQRDAANAFTPEGLSDPRLNDLLFIADLPNNVENPFFGTCSNCTHNGVTFCPIQKRRMLALDSCEYYENARDASELANAQPAFLGIGR